MGGSFPGEEMKAVKGLYVINMVTKLNNQTDLLESSICAFPTMPCFDFPLLFDLIFW